MGVTFFLVPSKCFITILNISFPMNPQAKQQNIIFSINIIRQNKTKLFKSSHFFNDNFQFMPSLYRIPSRFTKIALYISTTLYFQTLLHHNKNLWIFMQKILYSLSKFSISMPGIIIKHRKMYSRHSYCKIFS